MVNQLAISAHRSPLQVPFGIAANFNAFKQQSPEGPPALGHPFSGFWNKGTAFAPLPNQLPSPPKPSLMQGKTSPSGDMVTFSLPASQQAPQHPHASTVSDLGMFQSLLAQAHQVSRSEADTRANDSRLSTVLKKTLTPMVQKKAFHDPMPHQAPDGSDQADAFRFTFKHRPWVIEQHTDGYSLKGFSKRADFQAAQKPLEKWALTWHQSTDPYGIEFHPPGLPRRVFTTSDPTLHQSFEKALRMIWTKASLQAKQA